MIVTLIRQIMKARGLGQQDLADLIGASLSRVKAITSGRVAKLKQEEIKALVEELHVNADWLATGIGPMFRPPPEREQQEEFVERMRRINAMAAVVDALPLPAHEKPRLKVLLTGDPTQDGLLISQALQGLAGLSPDEQALIYHYKGSSQGDQAAISRLAKSVSRQADPAADPPAPRQRATGGRK